MASCRASSSVTSTPREDELYRLAGELTSGCATVPSRSARRARRDPKEPSIGVAHEEVHLMLIEPKVTRHTGDVLSERTVHEYARI